MSSAPPAGMTSWHLELGKDGVLPQLPGEKEGLLRIGFGDIVVFTIPAGACSGVPTVWVLDELGNKHEVAGISQNRVIGDWNFEWKPKSPGPYEIAAGSNMSSNCAAKFRIVVDPVLPLPGLPARGVVQLTVLSRCAGPIERWPEALASQALLGYNMVHFTPIQPPGESGSCYSLDEQNDVDKSLFEAPRGAPEERLAAVKKSVDCLATEHGMLSAMDIVLNHTSGSSPWLLDHPESAYSITNSPHLTAAAELDEKLAWFSDELRDGRFGGPHICNHGDIDRVLGGVGEHVLQPLKLWEYFGVDEEKCIRAYRNANHEAFERDDYDAFKASALPSIGSCRYGAFVTGEAARRYCRDEGSLRGCISRLRQELGSEWGSIERDIFEALRGLITYERLECKKGPVGNGHLSLVPRYFRRIALSASAKERVGKDTEVLAHNGWVMGWPATEDFGAPTWRFVYLRRHLCAWGDCVKLRYGREPADAEFLWDHMTRYAVSMAKIFHAIRLDNAHSTPLHVSKHILAQVRKVNPQCWIFAELFTGDFQTDLLFQRELGIQALVREAMQCDSPWDLSQKLQSSLWGAHGIGSMSAVPTMDRTPMAGVSEYSKATMVRNVSCSLLPARRLPLRPRHCPALLYDCTHDNETPKQKRHPRDALPNAALVAASCASIGSVRGYDDLFAFNPSVVFERRTYQTIEGVKELQFHEPPKDTVGKKSLQFIWPHAATASVVVRGSWDGWQSDIPLKKQQNGSWIATDLPSMEDECQYKFIVDGTWTYDSSQPTASDGHGGLNNVLGGTADENVVHGPDVRPTNQDQAKLPGIYAVKQVLNALHIRLAQEDYLEISGQHLAENIVAVQRRSPSTCQSTWFLTCSAFAKFGIHDGLPHDIATLRIPDRISKLHVAATLYVQDHAGECTSKPGTMSGLESHLRLYSAIGEVAHVWCEDGMTCLKLHHFPPGSVLVFSTEPSQFSSTTLERLLSVDAIEGLKLRELPLSDLSYLLYSCEAEEGDRSTGKRGSYDIPGFGPLVYSGLMGVCAALDALRKSTTDVSNSALVANIREGDWLLTYLVDRLEDMPSLQQVRLWLQKVQAFLGKLSRPLVPFYFDLCVSALCAAACNSLLDTSGPFVSRHIAYGPLVRDLALATAQFWGAVPSAPLHWDRAKEVGWRVVPSLSAGLPHFSAGFMRNWGRDTFIALRGCLLVTHRFKEARDVLLVYASVVRHGLVPNLLDAANNPRYNARDATWFFLQGVQDYVEMAPEGQAFLSAPVSLKWPVRDWDASLTDLEPATIADLIHLILSAHAKGIHFREWNAGKNIDEHMTHEGFNIDVRLDESSGLIYGGNVHNCGTWMDKMGSCEHAGNKGVPATPRDGAAIEINGLLKSTLRWVSSLHAAGAFKFRSVKTTSGAELLYKDWDAKIQASFEGAFWVGHDEKVSSSLRGFYRDTVGATRSYQDAQLRPNLCITMAVAPELFYPPNAKEALKLVSERLLGPLGMCTLDSADLEYRGDYHNDNDSYDKAVAHGWNYHQGPEWVWPLGFFLRAWFHFVGSDDEMMTKCNEAMRGLLCHRAHLAQDPWRSLPELTNSKGQTCHHSCPAQAWSLATILDALHAAATAKP